MLHARVKRALVPSAIVKRLDVSRARELPGVVAVLTAADIPGEHNHGLVVRDWPILVGLGEKVRTVGDAVAIVAAESREIATQALDLIEVEFEPLPVVTNPVQARQPDAPCIHPDGNLLEHIKVRKGDMQQGFAEADLIFEHTFYTPIHDHAFLEPECSIARVNAEGRVEVYVGSQIPYDDRNEVARALAR
jgi:xanthine dehydrogenase molybdenum-binding subunit